MQAVQRSWYYCEKTGSVMFPLDFTCEDGFVLHWYMEKSDTVKDVMYDIKVQTNRNRGRLSIGGVKLKEDMGFNEVMLIYISKKLKEAEGLAIDSRAIQHNLEDVLTDIKDAVSATLPRAPSISSEDSLSFYGQEPSASPAGRSRSPRNRSPDLETIHDG